MAKKAKARPKKAASSVAGRTRKLTKKQSKAKAKEEAAKQPLIPGSFSLTRQTLETIKRFWKPLGGVFIVYLLINVVFASEVPSNLNSTLDTIKQNLGKSHHLSGALSGYSSLLGGSGGGSQNGSITPTILLVLESLVIIWALRQLLAGQAIRVKQAYYRSMSPLAPFLLVIGFIFLQLLPLILGAGIFALVADSLSNGAVVFASGVLFALLAAWSVYMVSGSIFAIYIVTLPDMEPRPALRSAKKLVSYRRWPLLRRLFFLPLAVLVIMGVVTVPLILFAQILVVPVFYILVMLSIIFVHTYLYSLYRSLVQ